MSRRPQLIAQFIPPSSLPYPPPLTREITFLSYDIYENPNIPVGHPHAGKNGAWCRKKLRKELLSVGWTLNEEYSVISIRSNVSTALLQVVQLQTIFNLHWMPYGVRKMHVMKGVHDRSLY
ncbi:hypothetical protein Glove_26g240 [Diversispora epigaea]|uniref:Uncharacterized protein n=1 Tax=Diversispora epigaea TaxID=1348612 RepID=A0A397JLA5_9GLOM|nr:hypothetical protein Glove_26g240 [Diversispora epigaea]